MVTCPNCGTAVEGKFCVKCGLPVPGNGAQAGPQDPPQAPQNYPPPPAGGGYQQQQQVPPGYQGQPGGYPPQGNYQAPQSAGMQDNVAALLCYLFGVISAVLFLVLEPYNKNPNVRFHAFQSLFVSLGYFAVWIGLTILAFIPYLGVAFALILPFLGLGFLVLWIVLMVKAYQGQKWVLPVIGPMAEKQAYSN